MTQAPILIIDDNPKNVQLAAQSLAGIGRPLAFAQNGTDAISQAGLLQPDLILLDVMMPGMDGFEVCKALKQDPKTQSIPIIFLTAKSDAESLTKGFEVGGVDYVAKPFLPAELRARVETHLALRQTTQALLESNQTKDRFFSIISHDLKVPFNGLIGIANLLVEEFDQLTKEEMLPFLEGLQKSAQYGFHLLVQLLDWSRTQTGHIQWEPSSIDLTQVGQETLGLLREAAVQKKITLSLELGETTPVQADHKMIQTILRNLVSNAIKFTPNGGQVILGASASEAGWSVYVKDTGVGISENNLQKLFLLDQQFYTAGTAGEEGTGLGLLLCHEFAKAHGTRLAVESTVGQGTRFSFTLPFAAPPQD
ncbi:MAG: hypothetical protein A2600_10425 [Candidatus Lambdaproteobacteria bacterium RIFOXYD1_FULL_56_27]|uniref:histidine kinase n=1 Tax=Candidatus Lambdaproteobacteria bacterium RIFOXYD2_FULL_56_26 TaxID=1817773 RepID=A0A1F6GQB5_9PROT|nr:MAG: hypothetical protein A2557_09260 [Candidatus Lambdaproteobacteria bacterium RIFOXYD2_FULL_56_26]OGH04120.1 MAG: hypothetical protein A2426_02650 [Candidatus Lambdaproteobacteria bacterium RIFOXYC1_FULL_56_13]OGH06363.1 MAG: hypothetical protein A2600_10425 [Candidatus Lambdaproteobacteria bacterium RIFOXYD1_FULL_56_27]